MKIAAIISFSLLAACASSSGTINSKLDPLTAVTITYSDVPLVFYRDNSGAAAYARNFVHMAPIEVNRSGTFRYYVWLGIWDTVHSADLDTLRDGFESIVIYADGEPVAVELAGWSAKAIGASEPVLLKPMASAADAYYEVSVDHLRMLATSEHVRVQSTGNRPRSFELWDEQSNAKAALIEFLKNSAY